MRLEWVRTKSKKIGWRAACWAVVLALVWGMAGGTPGADALANPNFTTLISRNANETGYANSSWYPSITLNSGNRRVVYSSRYTYNGIFDTNGDWDVFVAVKDSGEITDPGDLTINLVSKDISGNPANGASAFGKISPNGRYVVFQSNASNLARCVNFPADNNGDIDIYLYDEIFPTCLWPISLNNNWVFSEGHSGNTSQYNRGSIFQLSYAPAALYIKGINSPPEVVFESLANLGEPVSYPIGVNRKNIWARTGQIYTPDGSPSGQTQLLTRGFNPSTRRFDLPANGDSWSPLVSDNGRFLTFISTATNLTASANTFGTNIYLMDRDADGNGTYDEFDTVGAVTVVLASHKSSNKLDSCSPAYSTFPTISADGNFVAFSSNCSDLVADDTNNYTDVFFYNRLTGDVRLVSRTSTGGFGDFPSFSPSLSRDGRYVAFTSYATNMVPGDSINNCGYFSPVDTCPDVFIRDLEEPDFQVIPNHITMVSRAGPDDGVQADNESGFPGLSNNSQYVSFQSKAKNLYENPNYDPPNDYNIYWRKWFSSPYWGDVPPGRSAYLVLNTNFHKYQDDPDRRFSFVLTNGGITNLDVLVMGPGWIGTGYEECWEKVASNDTCGDSITLAGSESCSFEIKYYDDGISGNTPACSVFNKTSLQIFSNDVFTTSTLINLEGGLPPGVEVTPGDGNYNIPSPIPSGGQKTITFTIKNKQGAGSPLNLAPLNLTVPGGPFTILTDGIVKGQPGGTRCPIQGIDGAIALPGNDSCTIQVKFTQTTPTHMWSNVLRIPSDDPDFPELGIAVHGGMEPAALLPAILRP